jgi:hypothetical protein
VIVPFAQKTIELDTEIQVDDWSTIEAIAKASLRKAVSNVTCCVSGAEREHDAIMFLVDGRPAAIIHGAIDRIVANVGGFDKTAIIHDGELDDLSKQVAAQKEVEVVPSESRRKRMTPAAKRKAGSNLRKAAALLRQSRVDSPNWAGLPLPRIVVKFRGLLGSINDRKKLIPIFRRDATRRVDEFGLRKSGPAPTDALLQQVKIGCGVAVLQTYHALVHLSLTSEGAKDRINQEVSEAGQNVETLLSTGRNYLAVWTGFDSEDELKRYSASKFAIFATAGVAGPRADRASRTAAELGNLRVLSRAVRKTSAIIQAFDRSSGVSARLAEIEIGLAYDVAGPLTTAELIAIAISLDINPKLIAKESEVSVGDFELFRFLGSLQRGADAFLRSEHLALLEDAIVADMSQKSFAQSMACELIKPFYPPSEILDAIKRVGGNCVLYATRRDRHLGSGEEWRQVSDNAG